MLLTLNLFNAAVASMVKLLVTEGMSTIPLNTSKTLSVISTSPITIVTPLNSYPSSIDRVVV